MSRKVLVLFSLLLLSTLVAADGWTLRVNLAEGDTQSYELTQTQKMKISSQMGDQEITSLAETTFDQTVKEVREDGALVLDTVYRRLRVKMNNGLQTTEIDTDKPDERMGLAAKSQGFLIDKPFTAVVSDRGEVLEIGDVDRYLDEMLESLGSNPQLHQQMSTMRAGMSSDAIKSVMQQSRAVLPEKELNVGDTWSEAVDLSNPGMGDLTIRFDYEALSSGKRKGRECIEIGVAAEFDFKSPESGMAPLAEMMGADASVTVKNSTATGSYWVDVERGIPVESNLDLTFEMEVSLTSRASGESTSMTSKIEQQIDLELQ